MTIEGQSLEEEKIVINKKGNPVLETEERTEGATDSTGPKRLVESTQAQEVSIFDPDCLSEIKNFSMGLWGKRRTGKTVLLKYILSKIHKFYSECHIFSGTSTVQQEIYGFANPDNIYDGYQENILSEIISDSQQKIKEALKNKPSSITESEYKKKLPYKMIILDDVISDKSLRYSKLLNDIFILGRHLNICVIFLSQTVTGIPKSMRANLDISAAFHLNNLKDSGFFIEQYFSDEGIKYGRELMNSVTSREYNAIVCKNFITSQNIYDRVFQITADPKTKDFIIGAQKGPGSLVPSARAQKGPTSNRIKSIDPVIKKSIKINFVREED